MQPRVNPNRSVYYPLQKYQESLYRPKIQEGTNRQGTEKYLEYIPLDNFQAQSREASIQPNPRMALIAHSSSEPTQGKRIHPSMRMKEFKFEDEDDLLKKKFETSFDDNLQANLGADFIGMVMILPAEFEKETEIENYDDDCFLCALRTRVLVP